MLIETRVALFQSGWELAAMADLTKVIRALPEDIEKAGISTIYYQKGSINLKSG